MRVTASIILFLLTTTINVAQESLSKAVDFFEFKVGPIPQDTNDYQAKIVLAPVVAYEPATHMQFGIGTKLLFKFKNSTPETRTSNLPMSVRYTMRNQFILATDFTFFTNEEKYLIKGKSRLLKYPFTYFGKGNLTQEKNKLEISTNSFLFEPLVLRRIYDNLFLGGGIRYNSIWNASLLDHDNASQTSSEFAKSLNNLSSGLELAINYDSRDNVLNALSGYFVMLSHGFYNKAFGGDNRFGITNFNARGYYKLWDNRLDVLAVEFYSRFTDGNVPAIEFSGLGGRERLRGYQERRFNDNHAVFLQTEYRWQMLERLGMVFFTGAGDVFSNISDDITLQNLKVSLGTGLRLKIVKSENLNIRMDYGFGLGPSPDHNFYLGIAEAF